MSRRTVVSLLFLVLLLDGCAADSVVTPGGGAMQLTSTAFTEGNMIPSRHGCDGDDLSPALAWSGAPAATKAYALIMDDPDAPAGIWVHWVLFNLAPDATALPEGVPPDPSPPTGGLHGANSWRRIGYGGPCPPGGTHRYLFKLYALDAPLSSLSTSATARDVVAAMRGHILAEAQLMGRYARR